MGASQEPEPSARHAGRSSGRRSVPMPAVAVLLVAVPIVAFYVGRGAGPLSRGGGEDADFATPR
jgi:hypothetical protein